MQLHHRILTVPVGGVLFDSLPGVGKGNVRLYSTLMVMLLLLDMASFAQKINRKPLANMCKYMSWKMGPRAHERTGS